MLTQSFNQWLKELGYHYLPGQERLLKGVMTRSEAKGLILLLESEGAITRG